MSHLLHNAASIRVNGEHMGTNADIAAWKRLGQPKETRMTKPKHPDLTPVESSAMKAAHYDHNTRDLHVEFPGGAVWVYPNVSAERGDAFMGSASKGKYLTAQIKPFHIGRKVAG